MAMVVPDPAAQDPDQEADSIIGPVDFPTAEVMAADFPVAVPAVAGSPVVVVEAASLAAAAAAASPAAAVAAVSPAAVVVVASPVAAAAADLEDNAFETKAVIPITAFVFFGISERDHTYKSEE